ncbi:UNVERIFIED_CONTAM: hypothetical protein Slati_1142200 [Sesamum latifolium]|uniref:Uncharacterized protein n=1 Tax=Sesamum latifolium TaxID=2727402 RepID=A0AAW2XD26_9LAMI
MKEKSWACTLITQLSLCIAAYVALNIGQPQKVTHGSISSVAGPTDMYFISVAGGFRPLEEQSLLLQQMMKVAKTYKARFVVSISELGESDSFLQNERYKVVLWNNYCLESKNFGKAQVQSLQPFAPQD